MQLIEVTEKYKIEYNQFVANLPTGSFLQSWEWGEWQVRLGRTVNRFKITDNNGVQVGSIQLIKMPLWGKKFYLYAPYGPVVIRNHESGIMNQEFWNELKARFPEAIFIRVEPKTLTLNPQSSTLIKSANIQPGKTLILDLTKPEEQLLSDMHHKTRYNIKLAKKHGVEVQDEFGLTIGKGLYAREALEQIAQTAKRQNYKAQGFDYFEKLVNFFAVQNNQGDLKLHIYKALYQKHLLASAIMVDFGKTRTYLFGGSSDNHREVMAPYLLHFKAMLDAKAQGLEHYDLWGIETSSGETPGFVRFKMGFAPQLRSGSSSGEIVSYSGAWDVAVSNLQYQTYKILRKLNRLF